MLLVSKHRQLLVVMNSFFRFGSDFSKYFSNIVDRSEFDLTACEIDSVNNYLFGLLKIRLQEGTKYGFETERNMFWNCKEGTS